MLSIVDKIASPHLIAATVDTDAVHPWQDPCSATFGKKSQLPLESSQQMLSVRCA